MSRHLSKKFFIIYCLAALLGLVIWWFVYISLPYIAAFITHILLQIPKGTHLSEAIKFFCYDTPKVLMLLLLVIYAVGVLRSFFTPQRTQKILAGKKEFIGNILAALLGIVTPFCSCSAVPLFVGFVAAGVPLGVTFSFLIAAPMVNEIALGLLYGLLGWKVAALYLSTGLVIAIAAGWIIGRLRMEKHVEKWVTEVETSPKTTTNEVMTWKARHIFAWHAVKDIIGRVWIYMLIGIAIGAAIHGYVPESLMASIMGKGAWWSVPLAVIIGIPIYSNAAGVIPIVEALLGKGAALGTVLAFMMSVVALSFPEMVILKRVLKMPLIFTFIIVVGCGILVVGYLFNFII